MAGSHGCGYSGRQADLGEAMKLAFCESCWDVFKLGFEMRQCQCGEVRGRYVDEINAEVSSSAVSLAIGNGSLEQAIRDAREFERFAQARGEEPSREAYIEQGRIWYAWVRPNTGRGNPHTRILQRETPSETPTQTEARLQRAGGGD